MMIRITIAILLFVQPLQIRTETIETPGGRVDPEMFFHNKLQKIVLIDGTLPNMGQPDVTEIWTWDGKTWEVIRSETGPSGRYASCAAYDSKRNTIVSFSGRAGKNETINNETWEWNGQTWKEVVDANMAARDHHSLCFDEHRGTIVLFGGGIFPRVQGPWATDTWEWDGKAWHQAATNGPPGRVSTMVYNDKRKEIILFGGVGAPNNGVQPKFNDTWLWSGKAWKKVSDQGPAERSRHAMVFDKTSGKVLLYGGENDNGPLSDMWQWDGKQWTEIKMNQPNPGNRYVHAMAYDEVRGVTVLYGGMHDKKLMSDTWEWNGKDWILVK